MIGHSPSPSRSTLLLLTVAFGMLGCITAPAPGEESVEVSEPLAGAGATCGGPRALTCRRTDYCLTPTNTCPGPQQRGICRPRPQICPNVFIPVCGCNGQTYPNGCQAARAGTSVAHQGACAPVQTCGGFGGFPCPGGGKCVDDPSDDCDPANGGADCGGICTCIENVLCIRGSHFDSSPQVCACVPDAPPVQTCGGIAGIPCPGGGKCVDNPNDNCDPANGGADCGGICTCVETVLCIRGSHFDSSPQVCACVPNAPVTCGSVTCPAGEVCCNASCGICTPPGFACIQIACN